MLGLAVVYPELKFTTYLGKDGVVVEIENSQKRPTGLITRVIIEIPPGLERDNLEKLQEEIEKVWPFSRPRLYLETPIPAYEIKDEKG